MEWVLYTMSPPPLPFYLAESLMGGLERLKFDRLVLSCSLLCGGHNFSLSPNKIQVTEGTIAAKKEFISLVDGVQPGGNNYLDSTHSFVVEG